MISLTEGYRQQPHNACWDLRAIIAPSLAIYIVLSTVLTTTFPFINLHAQNAQTALTSKKSNTNAPPKIIASYFHASSALILTFVTTIAHGRIQRKFEPSAWYRYHRGEAARRMAAI
jgi:hypothetical protein